MTTAAASRRPAVRAERLAKRYGGVTALDGLHLEVAPGPRRPGGDRALPETATANPSPSCGKVSRSIQNQCRERGRSRRPGDRGWPA